LEVAEQLTWLPVLHLDGNFNFRSGFPTMYTQSPRFGVARIADIS
jgi:hypothetical protein